MFQFPLCPRYLSQSLSHPWNLFSASDVWRHLHLKRKSSCQVLSDANIYISLKKMLKVTSCAYRKTHFLLLKSTFWLLITLINSRFLPKKHQKPSILRCVNPQFPLKSTQQVPQNGRHGRLNKVAVALGDQAQELGAHAATLLALTVQRRVTLWWCQT